MLKAYTVFHSVISLVAIVAGLVVLGGMLVDNPLDGWTTVFLWTTIATSAWRRRISAPITRPATRWASATTAAMATRKAISALRARIGCTMRQFFTSTPPMMHIPATTSVLPGARPNAHQGKP